MKEHICALKHRTSSDPLDSTIAKRSLTCTEAWFHMFEINRNTPRTKMYIDSMAAFSAERRRHAELKLRWIIHPFSRWRFLWDVIMTVVYMLSFLTIPFSVSFVVMRHDELQLDKFNFLIYAFCWLDIMCNFVTGYHDKKQMRIELKPLKIFTNYLKTFLLWDVISSLPWDHITLPWRTLPGKDSNHITVLLNLLPCLKLIRYSYVNWQIYELFTHLEIMYFYYEMFSTLLLGFYIIFWASCLCYLIPVLVLHCTYYSPDECPECWITGLECNSATFRFRYALFIVVEKLSASGYGSYVPRTDGHVILSCSLMMIGRVLECYILGKTLPPF
ncbi:Potassium/sodium hyperpolarization-activated cyclic nucleotide-gated channel 4 [Anthophora quadrimaculata]